MAHDEDEIGARVDGDEGRLPADLHRGEEAGAAGGRDIELAGVIAGRVHTAGQRIQRDAPGMFASCALAIVWCVVRPPSTSWNCCAARHVEVAVSRVDCDAPVAAPHARDIVVADDQQPVAGPVPHVDQARDRVCDRAERVDRRFSFATTRLLRSPTTLTVPTRLLVKKVLPELAFRLRRARRSPPRIQQIRLFSISAPASVTSYPTAVSTLAP